MMRSVPLPYDERFGGAKFIDTATDDFDRL